MAQLDAGESLGIKHKKINKLVQDAIKRNKSLDEQQFLENNQEMYTLMKIDVASHNRDINYILAVLKSNDLLNVSRAIKKSIWLVDDQYADVINPEYLKDHLFPYMKTKVIVKLMKHIRHYLKTEKRVEQFYKNETNSKSAAKWLSRCSLPFIEANVAKHVQDINCIEFKRLCERSVRVFEAVMYSDISTKHFKAASFLLHAHVDKYLDAFEKRHKYMRPNFGPCATDLIMKLSRDRVINNFFMYWEHVHIPTFVKHIKREEIKDFIYKLVNKEDAGIPEHYYRRIFNFDITRHFVDRMPKEEQFEFVKKVFLDKENLEKIDDNSIERGTETFATKRICISVCSITPPYHWYEFAPFSIAFHDIKQLIQKEDNKNRKTSMLNVLLKCAGANIKDLLALMTYYSKISVNDPIVEKESFVSNFFERSEMFKYDEDTWNAFVNIFTEMNITNNKDYQEYNDIVILYHILKNKEISETVANNFSFKSLQRFRKNLNHDEQNKVLDYLISIITQKIQYIDIQDEKDFNEAVRLLHQLLNLLLDWDKQLIDYEFTLNKIKDLIRIKIKKSWNIDLSSLYNKKKSWKRQMFEESVLLNPSQSTCINALKHDPGLLDRYKNNVQLISLNDNICLNQFLKKVRIYFPETVAANLRDTYIERLNKSGSYKALTMGLCTLLQHGLLLDIVYKYAPKQPKVDWNDVDEITLSLQRSIAKNMHIARPQPSADAILMYAKGDFLQYSLPSLLAIFYNMDRVQSQSEIPKLFNAPVSLQKHGVRFAFKRLSHSALKENLTNIWQTSKNTSIRAVVFELLFDYMCKEKDASKAEELWNIFAVFMDNLNFKEDKKVYKKLTKVREVPEKIKPRFLIKSYKFLQSFLPHCKEDLPTYEHAVKDLATYTRELMEFMSPVFVSDIITGYLNEDFFKSDAEVHSMLSVTSSYLLCAKDEETQMNKYEKNLAPIIARVIDNWNVKNKNAYFIRDHFEVLLANLYSDLDKYVFKNKMIIPIKMFTQIQNQLDKSLDVPQNYVMLTMWKLVVKLTDLIGENNNRNDWDQACSEVAPEFGLFCLEVLKRDVSLYFPCIYLLFTKALSTVLKEIVSKTVKLQIYEVLLSDSAFTQAFLVTLKFFKESHYFYFDKESKKEWHVKAMKIRSIIKEHPTVEVKMHYYNTFEDESYLVENV